MIHPDDLPPEVRAQMRPVDPEAEVECAEAERRLTARLEELEARVPREQARQLDPVENTRAIVDWVNESFGELPGWQKIDAIPLGANAEDCPHCGTDLPYPFICPGHTADEVAANTAARPAIPPQVELPRRVDALNDDVYSKIRARLAHLETVWQRQADEIGRLLGRVDSAQTELATVRAEAVKILADRELQRSRRDHLIVGIRMLADDLPDTRYADPGGIRLLLQGLLGTHKDRIHESSCPEHTGFKVCYCDCPDCRPDGVCACGHCRGWHRGHALNTPEQP